MVKPAVSVIGSFVVGISVRLPRMPYPGETLSSDLLDLGPGGKGSNVAVAARRLGADVVLVERVGDDLFAQFAYDLYRTEGIDVQHVFRTTGEQTGVGLVYLQPDGENTIGLFKGANQKLTAADVYKAEAALARSQVLTVQLEVEDETVLAGLTIARRRKLTSILNPAPARSISSEILELVDILTPNVGEACLLLGEPIRTDPSVDEVATLAKRLVAQGPKQAIITMGSKGAVLVSRERDTVHMQAMPVVPVDTVGAGDSFNAGLAVALAEGVSLELAMRRAAVSGALTTTRVGVIAALPTRDQMEQSLTAWMSA